MTRGKKTFVLDAANKEYEQKLRSEGWEVVSDIDFWAGVEQWVKDHPRSPEEQARYDAIDARIKRDRADAEAHEAVIAASWAKVTEPPIKDQPLGVFDYSQFSEEEQS